MAARIEKIFPGLYFLQVTCFFLICYLVNDSVGDLNLPKSDKGNINNLTV